MATPEQIPDDAAQGPSNFDIGTTLLCENDRVRVWEIRLNPGERHPFHCHRTSYYWVVHTGANIRATFPDGTYHDYAHHAGEVTYVALPPGAQEVHDLVNTGDTPLFTTTVELLQNDKLFWRTCGRALGAQSARHPVAWWTAKPGVCFARYSVNARARLATRRSRWSSPLGWSR